MKRYVVIVDRKPMAIEGDSCLDAMDRAGLERETTVHSIARYVGRLKDGRRYSVPTQSREVASKFHEPKEITNKEERGKRWLSILDGNS